MNSLALEGRNLEKGIPRLERKMFALLAHPPSDDHLSRAPSRAIDSRTWNRAKDFRLLFTSPALGFSKPFLRIAARIIAESPPNSLRMACQARQPGVEGRPRHAEKANASSILCANACPAAFSPRP